MKYKSMWILSYEKRGDSFEKLYEDRIHGDSTVVLDFMIQNYPAFFVVTNDINNLVSKIYRQHAQIAALLDKLPPIAVRQ